VYFVAVEKVGQKYIVVVLVCIANFENLGFFLKLFHVADLYFLEIVFVVRINLTVVVNYLFVACFYLNLSGFVVHMVLLL